MGPFNASVWTRTHAHVAWFAIPYGERSAGRGVLLLARRLGAIAWRRVACSGCSLSLVAHVALPPMSTTWPDLIVLCFLGRPVLVARRRACDMDFAAWDGHRARLRVSADDARYRVSFEAAGPTPRREG